MTDYAIWNELGLLHLSSGALPQAIHAYQSAIKDNAQFLPARLNLARAYTRNGDSVEAEKTYIECFDLNLDDAEKAEIWTRLSQLYASIGRQVAAQDAQDKADAFRAPTQPKVESVAKKESAAEKSGAHVDEALDTAMDKSSAPMPFARIKLENIYINPHQPRMRIGVETLVESVREHGILQPILVSPNGDDEHYILVSGHRRLEAARQLGLETIPAIVRKVDEKERLELALTENLQRRNLSSLEQADAYAQLRNEFGFSFEEIARRMGKSSVAISKMVQQLQLPERIKRALDAGRIEDGHAQAILQLDDPEKQLNALDQVLQYNLSVRKTEALVRLLRLEVTHSFDVPEEEGEQVEVPAPVVETESPVEAEALQAISVDATPALVNEAENAQEPLPDNVVDEVEALPAQEAPDEFPSLNESEAKENDLTALAESRLVEGDIENEIATYQEALLADPKNAGILERLGQLYIINEQYREASEVFQQAIELDPANIFLHCALAGSYRRMGMEDEASIHLAIAAPKMPKESPYNRACFEAICGNVGKAVELLDIALADDDVSLEKIETDPDFDFIRQEELFIEFVQSKTPVV